MKASVIIPTKNPGPLFRRILHTVMEQDTAFPFEVIVIDSGSRDGTREYLEGLAEPRLRVYCISPESFGHGATRNMGAALAHGEYLLYLTHDALPASRDWLARMVATAEGDPRIAGVFGRHVAYPDTDPYTAGELAAHFKGFAEHPIVWLDDPQRYSRDVAYRQMLHFFSNNNALIRRDVWERHPFPEVDFAEDQIWAKTVIEAGYKKAYAHDAVVMHSHNYGLAERAQRSFDEAYAFYRLFGYQLCPNVRALLMGWAALVRRDIRLAFRNGYWRTHPGATFRLPLEHFSRVLGHFLGARGDRLPRALRTRLSWDRRLLEGLRSARPASP